MLAPFIAQPWEIGRAAADWIRTGAVSVQKSKYERLLECAARIRYEFDYRIRYEQGLQSAGGDAQASFGHMPGFCRADDGGRAQP